MQSGQYSQRWKRVAVPEYHGNTRDLEYRLKTRVVSCKTRSSTLLFRTTHLNTKIIATIWRKSQLKEIQGSQNSIEEAEDSAKVKCEETNRAHDTSRAEGRNGKSEEGKKDREIVKDQRGEGVTRRAARQLAGQKYQDDQGGKQKDEEEQRKRTKRTNWERKGGRRGTGKRPEGKTESVAGRQGGPIGQSSQAIEAKWRRVATVAVSKGKKRAGRKSGTPATVAGRLWWMLQDIVRAFVRSRACVRPYKVPEGDQSEPPSCFNCQRARRCCIDINYSKSCPLVVSPPPPPSLSLSRFCRITSTGFKGMVSIELTHSRSALYHLALYHTRESCRKFWQVFQNTLESVCAKDTKRSVETWDFSEGSGHLFSQELLRSLDVLRVHLALRSHRETASYHGWTIIAAGKQQRSKR